MAMEEKDQTIENLVEEGKSKNENQTSSQNSGGISPIRTYKADIAGYVKSRDISLVDVAAEETKRKRFDAEKKKTAWLKIGALVAVGFVALGSAGLGYYAYNKKSADEGSGSEQKNIVTPVIIKADEEKNIIAYLDDTNFAKAQNGFLESIENAIDSSDVGLTKLRAVKELSGARRLMSSKEFLSLIDAKAPAIFVDYLDNRFEFFVLSAFDGEWPILLFKTSSYDYAYSGTLKWEKSMATDLAKIFEFAGEGRGGFKDKVLQNRDTRALYDEDEEITLLYSFINRKYLIITDGEAPMVEMFKRFSSPRYFSE